MIAYFGTVRAVPLLCVLYPGIALQLRKRHDKTSVGVGEEWYLAR